MDDIRYTVSASAHIDADPSLVYSIISNYKTEHARILPDAFSDLAVEQGGIGDGTVIRFQMRVLWRSQTFRAAITEPVPGRVLVETDLETNGAATTFVVEEGSARDAHVTISTELTSRRGVLGAIERRVVSAVLRPLYEKELGKLSAYAKTRPAPEHATV
jgi:hypothetical protein